MGGSNSKADLADILVALAQNDVSPDAHDFWDELWKLDTTAEDVFELITPDDVRHLRRERPENVVTLFTQATAQLCQIVHTPVPMYFGQALNCVRVLTRVLPFLLEDAGSDFCEKLCWGVESVDDDTEAAEPLARLVVHATLHLLFLPGFTVDSAAFEDEPDDALVPSRALWAPGLGGLDARPAASLALDRNRAEVLRLLLAASCEPLYASAETFDPWKSRWLRAATARDAPNAKLLLYALLNCVCAYDPTGLGVPYGGHLASDAPAEVVALAAQALVVLLDFGGGAPRTTEDVNVFRELLAGIDGADIFDFLFLGLARLLNNVHEALNTTLPGSLAQIECYQEILILVWKLVELNENFAKHVLTECDVCRFVVPCCFLAHQSRRDPSRVGLVHICTFILLKLSGERQFSVALNKPFEEKLPTDLPRFEGTHADFVVVVLHRMVVSGGDRLQPLYNCFLTILCNVSPYARSLSLVAAVKLVSLFELFTGPRILYAAEGNQGHVALLLEIFNNLIQYQYGGNAHLIYAIVRRKAVFDALDTLTLPGAIAAAVHREGERAALRKGEAAPEQDADAALPRVAPGTAAFLPSAEWLRRVKAELPLATIMRLLHHLAPQIEALIARADYSLDEEAILGFIRNTTMVGLLPVPHAIMVRKYQPNTFTSLWFTAFLWGVVFLQNQAPPLFDGGAIKLFTVSVV